MMEGGDSRRHGEEAEVAVVDVVDEARDDTSLENLAGEFEPLAPSIPFATRLHTSAPVPAPLFFRVADGVGVWACWSLQFGCPSRCYGCKL